MSGNIKLLMGNALDQLKTLDDESVNCVVTSPPYFNLRDYDTGSWVGGDPDCDHKPGEILNIHKISSSNEKPQAFYKDICEKCGAKRVDHQIGLEATPQDFIDNLCEIFTECKRVLKKDGTLWINIGDTYASKVKGLKNKDLIGVPWMLAFALRDKVGLYLRQDIIWAKPNPLPESVKDRCTKSHEYIFLFSKSPQYYFDHESIREDSVDFENSKRRYQYELMGGEKHESGKFFTNRDNPHTKEIKEFDGKRSKRDVWNVSAKPYSEAHFAVYPPDLIAPCILAGCPPDGTVLDPFAGSGTTGIVAANNLRNSILIELNEDYAKLIEKRWQQNGTLFTDFESNVEIPKESTSFGIQDVVDFESNLD